MIQEIVVESWEGLITQLYAGDWDSKISRHRSSFVFRGMLDATWSMKTSLTRLGGQYEKLEKHLLRNFRKYAHREVVERDSFWHWLAVAQHHGLPTRLLDWTYSPFVAMHFATDDLSKMETDGVIWCASMPEVHEKLPVVLKQAVDNEGSHVFTIDMLSGFERAERRPLSGASQSSVTLRDLEEFDRLTTEPFAMFIEPPSIDDRIVNQFALFSALSDPKLCMDEWLRRTKQTRKIVIPGRLKWQIRDKLDQANINERVIYPGLDGLSTWLKRHYTSTKR
jgi:hypothetical protein